MTDPTYNHQLGRMEADIANLKEGQARIEAAITDRFNRLEEELTRRLGNHSDRIGRLERWRSWIAGGLAAMGIMWAGVLWWLKGVGK